MSENFSIPVFDAKDWKEAILDELAISCMDFPVGTPPREIIKAVIAWHVQVALDPAVSDAQQPEAQAVAWVPSEPIKVFDAGPWTHDGREYSGDELDGAAFARYRDVAEAAKALTAHPTTPAVGVEAQATEPSARAGNLPTMNDEEYPGMGGWWTQVRIGTDSTEIYARCYADTPEESHQRAKTVAALLATPPAEPSSEGVTDEMVARAFNWAEDALERAGHSPNGPEMMAFYEARAALATKPAKGGEE